MALTYTPEAKIGMSCPDFRLPGVDGRDWQKSDFKNAKALVVMFICNHCPYVKAIEDRLIALAHDFKSALKDDSVKIVAISSNDTVAYPEDSFESMQKRAREKNYPFPYLFDETQTVAKTFGAVCTPDFFVYDQNEKLAYRGRLDDSWKDPSLVKKRELYDAVMKLVQGQTPSLPQHPSMGCNIKWK